MVKMPYNNLLGVAVFCGLLFHLCRVTTCEDKTLLCISESILQSSQNFTSTLGRDYIIGWRNTTNDSLIVSFDDSSQEITYKPPYTDTKYRFNVNEDFSLTILNFNIDSDCGNDYRCFTIGGYSHTPDITGLCTEATTTVTSSSSSVAQETTVGASSTPASTDPQQSTESAASSTTADSQACGLSLSFTLIAGLISLSFFCTGE